MPPAQIVSVALSALLKSAVDNAPLVTPFPSMTPTFKTRDAVALLRTKTWNKSWRRAWAIMVDDRGPKVACLTDATCVRAGSPQCDEPRMGGGDCAVMQVAGTLGRGRAGTTGVW